jgi:hypothetical protein
LFTAVISYVPRRESRCAFLLHRDSETILRGHPLLRCLSGSNCCRDEVLKSVGDRRHVESAPMGSSTAPNLVLVYILLAL